MSWLTVNEEELNEELNKVYEPIEPGVYNVVLSDVYIDETSGGTQYINIDGLTKDDRKIILSGWDVNRMIKSKTGEVKSSKGNFYNGIIILGKMVKCIGKEISDLKPTDEPREIWNESKNVKVLSEFIGKEIEIGVRKKKYWNQSGEEKSKLDLVDVVCSKDTEAIEKLKKRIEKKPLVEDTSNKPSVGSSVDTNDTDVPF